jgi:hypothetical protein
MHDWDAWWRKIRPREHHVSLGADRTKHAVLRHPRYQILGSRRTRASAGNNASKDRRIRRIVFGSSDGFSQRIGIYVRQTLLESRRAEQTRIVFKRLLVCEQDSIVSFFKSQPTHPVLHTWSCFLAKFWSCLGGSEAKTL